MSETMAVVTTSQDSVEGEERGTTAANYYHPGRSSPDSILRERRAGQTRGPTGAKSGGSLPMNVSAARGRPRAAVATNNATSKLILLDNRAGSTPSQINILNDNDDDRQPQSQPQQQQQQQHAQSQHAQSQPQSHQQKLNISSSTLSPSVHDSPSHRQTPWSKSRSSSQQQQATTITKTATATTATKTTTQTATPTTATKTTTAVKAAAGRRPTETNILVRGKMVLNRIGSVSLWTSLCYCLIHGNMISFFKNVFISIVESIFGFICIGPVPPADLEYLIFRKLRLGVGRVFPPIISRPLQWYVSFCAVSFFIAVNGIISLAQCQWEFFSFVARDLNVVLGNKNNNNSLINRSLNTVF